MTRVINYGGEYKTPKKTLLTCIIVAAIGLLLTLPIELVTADTTSGLEITNLSGAKFNFTYAQLLEMPKAYVWADLYCYGNLITTGNWGGITLGYLLSQANLTSEVVSIQFIAADGYRVSIPVSLVSQPEIIIAYEKDDQPLSEGFRLILPGLNGAVWIAQIVSINMSTSATNYPEVVGDGGGSIVKQLPALDNPTPSASPTQTPVQTQPTPKPTPQRTSNIQAGAPANITHVFQPTPAAQIPNGDSGQQTLMLYAIAFAVAIPLAATASVAYIKKSKS